MVLLQFSSRFHNLSSVCILVNFHVTLLHAAIFYRLLTVQALQVIFASLNFASFVSLLLKSRILCQQIHRRLVQPVLDESTRIWGTRYIYFWNIHGLRDMPFFCPYSQLSKMVWQSNIYMVLRGKIAFFYFGILSIKCAQKR